MQLITKSKLSAPLKECTISHNWNVCNCLDSADIIISNVGSCGDGLQITPQNQRRQGSLLKVVKVDEFSSSI